MGINDRIADRIIGHSVNLGRFSESVRQQVLDQLLIAQADIENHLKAALSGGYTVDSFKVRKLNKLLEQTNQSISTAYKTISRDTSTTLMEVADLVQKGEMKAVNWEIGADIMSTALGRNQLKAVVSNAMIQGSPAKDWWAKQSADTQQRFASQIRMGVYNGETNYDIVKRLFGQRTGSKIVDVDGKKKVIPTYAGGVLDTSKAQATALVRTAVQTVANDSKMNLYKENDDVLKGYQALVTLDSRTSDICMARSGAAWDFEGNPLPESTVKYKFPGPPPWHFQCRTILIPITKSWAELAKDDGLGKEMVEKLEKVDEVKSSQASMDGQVAGDLKYEDWLKTKPEAFQKDMLGQPKWDLWKTGKIGLTDLVDQSGNPLSLEQLKTLYEQRTTKPVPASVPEKIKEDVGEIPFGVNGKVWNDIDSSGPWDTDDSARYAIKFALADASRGKSPNSEDLEVLAKHGLRLEDGVVVNTRATGNTVSVIRDNRGRIEDDELTTVSVAAGKKLSETQRKAIYKFTGNEYVDMRFVDRRGLVDLTAEERVKLFKEDPGVQHQMGSIGFMEKKVSDVKNFYKGIEEAPVYAGHIYRGMEFEGVAGLSAFKELQKSNTITMGAMTSFSRSAAVADSFASITSDDNRPRVILRVKSKSGRAIEGVSELRREREVVLGKNTKLRVLSRRFEKHPEGRRGYLFIDAEEI